MLQHRSLITQLLARDIASRYRGSMLGIGWSLLMPLLMLAVYTFVFGMVFKARWHGDASTNLADFALMLFAGLTAHAALAESLGRSPGLMLQHANFIKKVVFPIEIVPLVSTLSVFFHMLIGLAVLLAATLFYHHEIPVTAVLIPVVLLPYFFFILGTSYGLAALGVFARDIGQLTQLLATLLLFMGPVFYPISALPEFIQPFFWLNPLTPVVEQLRQVILLGQIPQFSLWLLSLLFALSIFGLGYLFFRITRRGFADVL